ncbi:MAG TPA: tRNA (adenosine(37)-N6)-threonylcarbamoyltransferase complex ATPase subunit type 1 TsaE [Candidatus Dormibacteraeota bacterium]|nr:tRNA (adenosine(37)-N6)-threonylcarbamoyltransferase complex ATPase subunit type 1 TsaE [Candidatus Dormibacteraeota bacterium]
MIDRNTADAVVLSDSPLRTEALGRTLGAALQPGDVLALDGDLGAGKTVLVRGLAEGAGADPLTVRSPTFVLHHVYRGTRLTLHHLDCYRLGEGADLAALDVDALAEDGALAVEWGAYAPRLAELNAAHVHIDVLDGTRRRITLRALPAHLRAALDAQR